MLKSTLRAIGMLIVAEFLVLGATSVSGGVRKSDWEKSPGNPVLSLSAEGGFDSHNIFAPAIAKYEGRYYLFYSGGPSGPLCGEDYVNYQLGLAISDDGVHFRKTGRPLLPLAERDNFHVTPALLRSEDGSLLRDEEGSWHMLFTGNRADDVEHAASRDGLCWQKDPQNPVYRKAYAPNLLRVGNQLWMYYTHKPADGGPWEVHLAVGDDFHSLRPHEANPMLKKDQAWERASLIYPYVLRKGKTWLTYYAAYYSKGGVAIGEATSTDGVHWTKNPHNPILEPTPKSGYDSVYAACPAVIRDGNDYKMYYAGRIDGVHKYYAIALATETHAPQERIEETDLREHAYEIHMDGTLDGFNTVDYAGTYGGSMRQESRFQPNEHLVLENISDVDVVNPRIVVNGRRDWHSADSILRGILKPDMSDAEKAMAIFGFTSGIEVQTHNNNRRVGPPFPDDESHPSRNNFKERANPVKAANCYYCSGCSLSAANLVIFARHAGLIARAIWICPLDGPYKKHCVAEVWHDGGWHLYDPEYRVFYLAADNTTVASYKQLHDDPSLIARTHHCGFANEERLNLNSGYDQNYPPKEMPVEQWLSSMDMTLRPGEQFIWRWRHENKYRHGDNYRNDGRAPYQLANGIMIYRPKFTGECFRRGIVSANNLEPVQSGDGSIKLQSVVAGSPGYVIYRIRTPYPIVGGLLRAKSVCKTTGDVCRVSISLGDSDWIELFASRGSSHRSGPSQSSRTLEEIVDLEAMPALYEYYVKLELLAAASPGDARLLEACFQTDVEMAATSLPALSVGENRVVYRDESGPGAKVRIRHGWRENSDNCPPPAPDSPIEPSDGGRFSPQMPQILKWQPSVDPDGESICQYHIQVSPRRDMLHPISPNFDRILFSNSPQWTLPQGWLVEGRIYYWRVRAQDASGAWSDWSRVWRFSAEGFG